MIKTIFMDLDGTLLNENGQISKKTKEILHSLSLKGINYFIATGRPYQLLKGVIDDLGYSKELITMNGSVVLNPSNQSILYKNSIENNVIKRILKEALAKDYLIMLYGDNAIYSNENERVHYFKKQFYNKPNDLHPKFIGLNSYKNEDISKILIVEHNQKRYDCFKSFVSQFNVSVVKSQKGFLDINPMNVSKGIAIQAILDKYNLKKEETIAFGDQENDIAMMDYVSKFIAMDNATSNVKQRADEVTLPNYDHGVAYWIENNLLK